MVGYFEDGPNLVTMAMNGWADGEPAWWLNLQSESRGQRRSRRGPRRSGGGPQRERNGRDCGTGGARSTRTWTTTRRAGPARPPL